MLQRYLEGLASEQSRDWAQAELLRMGPSVAPHICEHIRRLKKELQSCEDTHCPNAVRISNLISHVKETASKLGPDCVSLIVGLLGDREVCLDVRDIIADSGGDSLSALRLAFQQVNVLGRTNIMACLCRMDIPFDGTTEARSLIEMGLKDAHPDVRSRAVDAGKLLFPDELFQPICSLITDNDFRVRLGVLGAIADKGKDAAHMLPQVMGCLRDPNTTRAAIETITEMELMGAPAAADLVVFLGDTPYRMEAMEALRWCGEGAFWTVFRALADKCALVCADACELLDAYRLQGIDEEGKLRAALHSSNRAERMLVLSGLSKRGKTLGNLRHDLEQMLCRTQEQEERSAIQQALAEAV